MSSTITHFFGQALTGQGTKNLYKELMKEADEIYVLKDVYGFHVSELLKKIGQFYSDQGFHTEYFHDPFFETAIEATFVRGPKNILFLLSVNPSIKTDSRLNVISFAHCLDVEKLSASIEKLTPLAHQKNDFHQKCFQSLSEAIKIHDDWEVETRRYMDWNGLDEQTKNLFQDVFGDTTLNKKGKGTHRLLGTLTPEGARDTVQSITQNLEQRLFIKGYPGTGKSSMMKTLAKEALTRGFDVQMVWCGLDSNSIDMVILPELKFCIFDSTEPHLYFPEREGDEIFDIAKHCHPTDVELTNIKQIVDKYRAAMSEATTHAKSYAQVEREIREIFDGAIIEEKFEAQSTKLFKNFVG